MHEGEPISRTILPIFGQGVSLFLDRKPKEKMPLIQRKILSNEEVDLLMKKYCSNDAVSTRAKFPLWINSFQQQQQQNVSTKMIGQIDLRKEKMNLKGGYNKQQFESQTQLKGDTKTKIELQNSDIEVFRFKTECQSTTKLNFSSQESGKYLKNNNNTTFEPLLKLKSSQLQMNTHLMFQRNEKKRLQVIEFNSSCRAILKGNKNNTSLQSNKQVYPVKTNIYQNQQLQTQDCFTKNNIKKDRQLTVRLNENTPNNDQIWRTTSIQKKQEFGCDTADLEWNNIRAPLQSLQQPYQKRMRATSQKEQLSNNILKEEIPEKRLLNDEIFPQTSNSRLLKLDDEEEKMKKREGNDYQSSDQLSEINISLRDRSRTSYQEQNIFPSNKLIQQKNRDLLGMRQISAPDCHQDTDEDEFFRETAPLNVSIQSKSSTSEDFDELEQYYKQKYINKYPVGLGTNGFNYGEIKKIQQSSKKFNYQQKKGILPKIVNLKQGDHSDLQPWEQTAMNSQFLFFGSKVDE